MEVGVRALGHVVVDDNVDSLDVHSSAKEVSGHHDTLVEALEGLVLGQPAEGERGAVGVQSGVIWCGPPLLLGHASVDADGGEVLLHQKLGQSYAPLDRLDKDDHLREVEGERGGGGGGHNIVWCVLSHHTYLVELEGVKEVKQLPVLLFVLELHVVLLETMQGQFRLIVNVHLHRLRGEGLACQRGLLTGVMLEKEGGDRGSEREGGGEGGGGAGLRSGVSCCNVTPCSRWTGFQHHWHHHHHITTDSIQHTHTHTQR